MDVEKTQTLACPRCSSREVISINLALEHGDQVSFFSCHQCDSRWWNDADGEPVTLPAVLDKARRRTGGSAGTAGSQVS